MRRFYAPVESFENDRVLLGSEEARHLRDVLRLRVGDTISVFDGKGSEYKCRVDEIGKKSAVAIVEEQIQPLSPESPLDLTLSSAVLKGEKFDLVVQKAVELGVRRLIPLQTIRCDVKTANRLERWRRIALEATKQSGRAAIMDISETAALSDVITRAETNDIVLFSERNGNPMSELSSSDIMTAIVGPEGGWYDQELEAATQAGVQIITLRGRILRAETAAIAVTAILQNRFGDLN